jgi:glycosyltransferase involved in cell wall biosynthesis
MPKITVIIPNYNHANFLEKRIQSVLDQTYQDFEVILLDDASTDHSRDILQAYAQHPRVHKVIFNPVNTKIPFKQWNKGLREARGEYIWIAESDDYADPRLLEKLILPLEAHPNIGVSYCQSWKVDEADRVLASMQDWTDRLDRDHWATSYINSGIDECRQYLCFQSTIPNASAVLFRRSVYEQIGGADESFRLSGDWLLWAKMLLASDIAFTSEPLNYFRTHSSTVRGGSGQSNLPLKEAFQILEQLAKAIPLDEPTQEKAFNGFIGAWLAGAITYRWTLQAHLEVYQAFKQIDHRLHQRMAHRLLHGLRKRLLWEARPTASNPT